jgi:glycosyltransferase involved in cell wall biosynthesis
VATHEPRKNLVRLLDAFEQMQAGGELQGYRLVLVGGSGWKNGELDARIKASPAVVRTGYVDDAALPALYAHAEALVFASTYEGFGMPVLEARLCGTRIVTTDIPELREAGGDDAVYVQPSTEGIRNGIRQVVATASNERARQHQSCVALEQHHNSWRVSARLLAEQVLTLQAGTAGQLTAAAVDATPLSPGQSCR